MDTFSERGDRSMMGFHGFGGMGGWGLLGGVLVLLPAIALLAVLAGLAIWLWRRSDSKLVKAPLSQQSPQEILKMRYARGELSREEFQSAMQDLHQFGQ